MTDHLAKQGKPTSSVLERAIKEEARDTSLVDEAFKAGDLEALKRTSLRLIEERLQLARGIEAMAFSFGVLREVPQEPTENALQAVERIATESIQFAREIFRLVYSTPIQPTTEPEKRKR